MLWGGYAQTYKSFTEDTSMELTKANINGNSWIIDDNTQEKTKTGNIDPVTDTEVSGTYTGLLTKFGNRTLTFYVTNVSSVKIYFLNAGSSGADRQGKLTISEENEETTTESALASPKKSNTITATLNSEKKYKLSFTGYDAAGTSAAEVLIYYINFFVPTASSESLTTAASGFATYAASYSVNYSNLGLTCYQISLDEANKKVAYTPYTGVVPANKAVLVQGEASKEYTLTKVDADDNNTFSTDLQASDGTIKAANNLYYAFSTKNGVSGFYRVQNDLTIPKGRGYLQLSNASEAKFFSFDGGVGTTGIGNIENIEEQIILDNATIYNLAGQRVSKDYKGVIIVNGKKMVNK